MALVDALDVTNLLELPRNLTFEFEEAMRKHVEGKLRLFKDIALVPYDHLALHYGEVMREYGPSPTHNGSYYERHIRHLNGFNTNMKSGAYLAWVLFGLLQLSNPQANSRKRI